MKKNNALLKIPYGTRDFLPEEAAAKRIIEEKLAELFSAWGYDEVVTPTMEYLDTLTMGSGGNQTEHLFKLFDRHNSSLALRHEMTTPIARLVSGRLKEQPSPVKLAYLSSAFRYEEAQAGRQCEFHQGGVELMGSGSAAADAEVIALAIESLRAAGLKNFRLFLGQVEFVSGIMEQYQLSDKQKKEVKTCVEGRDLVGLNHLADGLEATDAAKEAIKKIPLLCGVEETLQAAYAIALNPQSRRALDNLSEIYELLQAYDVAQYVVFDLGLLRDFSYYTGMVFEVYTEGLGYPLCGGGRYDHLLADFGHPASATGFALGIERLLLAMERQGCEMAPQATDVYLGYGVSSLTAAIKEAKRRRAAGQKVELATMPQTQEDAAKKQQERGCRELVYIP
ncbi:MAG: ATP phosphoribosyltransferase regulatory subunit [Selenomonadaceae bacterium]|nr:ATP phosphoribosyltransferase regulatory subunit [Selenomonadaceae bacterium]